MMAWIVIGLIITIFAYALLSILLRKTIGLFIAGFLHLVLGVLSLPSIGWLVILLAIIEVGTGLVWMQKNKGSTS